MATSKDKKGGGKPAEKKGPIAAVKSAVQGAKHVVEEAKHVVEAVADAAKTVVAVAKGDAAPAQAKAAAKQVAKAATAAVTPSAPSTTAGKVHSFRRKLIGRVTSDKMNKTVVVEVSRYSPDPVYKKYVKQRSKYKAHDENNEYKVGDRVEIQEHRPISREKRWKVVRLVSRPVLE